MSEQRHPILSVDFRSEYDTLTEGISNRGRACVDLGAIQGGLIKQIGANRFGVLLAILSFMDKDGKSFPSQRKLAELTGQSANTVNKLINELLEIEYDGQKVLKRNLIGEGARKRSMYYIHAGEVSSTEAIELPKAATGRMNSRDIALYFADVYKAEFGAGYVVSWGRDLALIKNKIIPAYEDDETITGVIDVAVKRYKKMWGNENYPTPTISMLCSWLANKAHGIYAQEKAKEKAQAERIARALQLDDTDAALEML